MDRLSKLPKPKKVKPKHQRFVLEYLSNGFNATQAYQTTYLEATYATARTEASKLLAKHNIQDQITTFLEENSMKALEILARLERIARSSAADWLSFDENGKPFCDLAKLEKAGLLDTVKSVKHTQHGVNIEFHDKIKALELLGKHHKLWTDRVALENVDCTPLILNVGVMAAPPRTDLEGIDED